MQRPDPRRGSWPRRYARPLLALAAAGIVGAGGVAAAAGPTPAADPRAMFGQQAVALRAGPAAVARQRAGDLARALGLRGTATGAEEVRDAMLGRVVSEVTLAEGPTRTGLIVHDAASGRPLAITNLAWGPGDDAPRLTSGSAPAVAERLVRAAGLAAPAGAPEVRWDDAADAWEISWARSVAGIPVPRDGMVVRLRPGGALASLSAPESPLAPAPRTPLSSQAALAVARHFAEEHGLVRLAGFAIEDRGLAWSETNGFLTGQAAFHPTLRLCRVIRLAFTLDGASGTSLIELHVDATDGAIVGGDQTS